MNRGIVAVRTSDAVRDYLARIGLDVAPAVDVDGLVRLQRAHRLAIAFENLDVPLGRGIDIAPVAVAAKLVGQRRGGYCFEQNGLFLAQLKNMGFVAWPLLARVWLGVVPQNEGGGVPPRTHMLVLVTLDGRDWIVDVGFGGSFTPPLPLEDGAEAETPDGARHRLRRAAMAGDPDGQWLLERNGAVGATDGRSASSGWQPQYGFAVRAVTDSDIAQCNHWTATRTGTRFTSFCIVSRVLPDGFASMMDLTLSVHRSGASTTQSIEGPDEYRAVLSNLFGIELTAQEILFLPIFATKSV